MSAPPPSDPTAARRLAGVLQPGETIIWAGRPDARHFERRDGRLLVLGAFWIIVAGAAFAGFGITLLADSYGGLPLGVRLFLLLLASAPFVAVAFFCLGGHVLLRRWARRRTAYAITDRRVMAVAPTYFGLVGPTGSRELPRERAAAPVVETVHHEVGSLEVPDTRSIEAPIRFELVRGIEDVAAVLRDQRSEGT